MDLICRLTCLIFHKTPRWPVWTFYAHIPLIFRLKLLKIETRKEHKKYFVVHQNFSKIFHGPSVLHANQKSNHSNLLCAFCTENHFSDKCPKVTDIATVENISVILGVVLCVLDQNIKFRNAQVQKCVIIVKNEKIPINAYSVPLICHPLKDQVFDIKGFCFEHLKGFEFGDCLDGRKRLMF